MTEQKVYDLIIVGAGPAALTAAIYTTREDIDTLVFEKGVVGGLAAITDKIDNYPGFPNGVAGLTLADDLRQQAERFGTVIELADVQSIVDQGETKLVKTTSGDYQAKAILIATGCDYKKLAVPGEKEYYARGVHYCATCDGAFYRDKKIAVIGGGNSAIQETLFLTRYASHIDILVRSQVKASDILIKELEEYVKKGQVTVHLNTVTEEILGQDNLVTSVKTTSDGQPLNLSVDGVFIFIGLLPNSQFVKDLVELNPIGFINTDSNLQTNVRGIFVAGDVHSGATMQIASAAGEGATAALKIREFLEGHEH